MREIITVIEEELEKITRTVNIVGLEIPETILNKMLEDINASLSKVFRNLNKIHLPQLQEESPVFRQLSITELEDILCSRSNMSNQRVLFILNEILKFLQEIYGPSTAILSLKNKVVLLINNVRVLIPSEPELSTRFTSGLHNPIGGRMQYGGRMEDPDSLPESKFPQES